MTLISIPVSNRSSTSPATDATTASRSVLPAVETIEQNSSTTVLDDDVSFENALAYVQVPADEYDLQIREATPGNDSQVTPENAFELVVIEDDS